MDDLIKQINADKDIAYEFLWMMEENKVPMTSKKNGTTCVSQKYITPEIVSQMEKIIDEYTE